MVQSWEYSTTSAITTINIGIKNGKTSILVISATSAITKTNIKSGKTSITNDTNNTGI